MPVSFPPVNFKRQSPGHSRSCIDQLGSRHWNNATISDNILVPLKAFPCDPFSMLETRHIYVFDSGNTQFFSTLNKGGGGGGGGMVDRVLK